MKLRRTLQAKRIFALIGLLAVLFAPLGAVAQATVEIPSSDEPMLEAPPEPAAPGEEGYQKRGVRISLDMEEDTGYVGAIKVALLFALLALAPSMILAMTSFTRIIVVLSLLRQAVGVVQLPPTRVLVGLAMFLTLFTMQPVANAVATAVIAAAVVAAVVGATRSRLLVIAAACWCASPLMVSCGLLLRHADSR